MRPDQDLRLVPGQRLVMTPQLRQAVEVLQLGAAELEAYLGEQIRDNPLLEWADEGGDAAPPETAGAADPAADPGATGDGPADQPDPPDVERWLLYFADSSDLGLGGGTPPERRHRPAPEAVAAPGANLRQHLSLQLAAAPAAERSDQLRRAAGHIIAALDEADGYLRVPLDVLAAQAAVGRSVVGRALRLVQGFDPPGVAARNLTECLTLQLERVRPRPDLAITLVGGYLDDVAVARFGRLADATGATTGQVEAAIDLIRSLDPRPGGAFAGGAATRYIVPDASVERVDGDYVVLLNDGASPRIRINAHYRRMVHAAGGEGKEAREFLQKRLGAARWLLRCVAQRGATLLRVIESIVGRQRAFFDHGALHLKPLTLKDVAGELGVHESTVSRAVANKYVQTPLGCYELRYFFASGLGAAHGPGRVSSTSVKLVLKELIGAEDAGQPHSDQKLADLLRRRGAQVSRRTVTKYRREMGVPAAAQRRRP